MRIADPWLLGPGFINPDQGENTALSSAQIVGIRSNNSLRAEYQQER